MKLINQALAYIENHVHKNIELAELAAHLSVSTVYLSKIFKLNLGEAPIKYARARRLSEAGLHLVLHPDKSILEVALEFGLESHEAFTRSFKKQFSLTPEKFRTMEIHQAQCLLRGPLSKLELNITNEGVSMKPKIIEMEAFLVVGLRASFNPQNKHNIPELWPKFVRKIAGIPHTLPVYTYGVCTPSKNEEGEFDYMAAIGVSQLNLKNIPEGLEGMVIPQGKYAVFTHKLDGIDIHKSILSAHNYIWQEWLPHSGFQYTGGIDFELCDQRFDPQRRAGEIDIYIPIG